MQTWDEHAPDHEAMLDYIWAARVYGARHEARRWRRWLWVSLAVNALLLCWLARVLAK